MSSFKQRSDYFKLIATKNKLIAHNGTVAGDTRTRAAFHRVNDEDELNAACKNWGHFPCVVHIGHDVIFTHPDTGMPHKRIGNHLYFLALKNSAAYPFEADAIEEAYDEAFAAMMQFVSYMLNEMEEKEICGRELFVFNLNRSRANMLPCINQTLYGWYLIFEDESKAKEMNYNADLWSDNFVGSGGNGSGGGDNGSSGDSDMINFTDVIYSLINGVQTFTFSGGNLVGATEINIELYGNAFNTLPEGENIVQLTAPIGRHQIKWRRSKNGVKTPWSNIVNFEVINTGAFTLSLADSDTLNDNAIQFPVKVAQVTTIGGFDNRTNSNQIANNAVEFITIWNSLNSANSILTSSNYHIYTTIVLERWEFHGSSPDYVSCPKAAWCFPV